MVQPLIIEEAIEADHGAVLGVGGPEDDPADPGVQDRPRAHGAGFERHIERCPRQAVISRGGRRQAQDEDLRVGRRIAKGDGTVVRPREALFPPDEHRPDRHLSRCAGQHRLLKGDAHPLLIDVYGNHRPGTLHHFIPFSDHGAFREKSSVRSRPIPMPCAISPLTFSENSAMIRRKERGYLS
jgi:hypothetical protein